ncbi:MAG: zinc-binding dehydrogenase [Chloroflexia bacterium]
MVNPSRESLGEVVRSLRPQGADVVIDTTGRSDQFEPCIDLLRWEGSFLMQGWYPDPVVFDFHATHHKKPTIAVTCGFGPNETTRVLDLMRYGKLRFREVVSHLSPPDEAPAIYARLAAADPDMLGVVFDWTGGAE